MPETGELLAALADRIRPGAQVLRAEPVPGSSSTGMTAFVVRIPGEGERTWVLRRPGGWALQENPQAAAAEFRLLGMLHAAGVPVPPPLHLAVPGEAGSTACLVLEYVAGEVDVRPEAGAAYTDQAPELLAAIHRLDAVSRDLAFLPDLGDRVGRLLAEPAQDLEDEALETQVRARLRAAWPWPQAAPTLLHGDFWPGNLLWRDGRLAAVVDWEDAAVGDPLADLAVARLDVLWAFGETDMVRFTRQYQNISGRDLTLLPFWDLWAALRPGDALADWAAGWPAKGRPEITAARLRGDRRRFIEQALQALA